MPHISQSGLSIFKWITDVGSYIESEQCIAFLESEEKDELVRLYSPVSGRLLQIVKRKGNVKPGDVLAEIDVSDNSDNFNSQEFSDSTDKSSSEYNVENASSVPNASDVTKESNIAKESNVAEEKKTNVAKESDVTKETPITTEQDVNKDARSGKKASQDNERSNSTDDRQKTSVNDVSATKETGSMTNQGNPDKVIPILMPKAGQSVEEASLVKWNVKVGDEIKEGQIIFEIETDKATIEVEATDSGKLAKIVVDEGDVVPVLTPVAYIAESQADLDAYLAQQQEGSVKSESTQEQEKYSDKSTSDIKEDDDLQTQSVVIDGEGRIKASPAAKKLAREKGINLKDIKTASGPDGRIILRDVESAIASASHKTSDSLMSKDIASGAIKRKLTPMRKAIAKNLTFSKQNIPHFYMKITVDADPIYEFYQTRRKQYKCSINDVLIAACGKVIMEFPAFRSRMEGPDELTEYSSANIGIAVGLENGLVVPVVLGVEGYSFEELAKETRRIIQAARQGKPENMGKGVFTISNLGMYDIDEFSAIVNPPEASILAVGGMKESVIVKAGTLRIGKTMSLTLSCDHRVIDGLLAAQFLGRLREILENPSQYIK